MNTVKRIAIGGGDAMEAKIALSFAHLGAGVFA